MPPMGFLRPLRFIVKALVAEDSPKQLAAGIALGMVVGLIPKTSLLSTLGFVLICLLQVNLAAGYASVAVFSIVAPMLDPIAHRIGEFFLIQTPGLAPLWTALYNVPILPWTGFNNTVVLGSTVVGLVAVFPFYKVMVPLCDRYRKTVAQRLKKFKFVQLLLGANLMDKVRPGGA